MKLDDLTDSEIMDSQIHWHSPDGFFTDGHADQGTNQGRDEPAEPDFWDFSAGELLIGAIAIVAMVIFSVYFPMGIWHK